MITKIYNFIVFFCIPMMYIFWIIYIRILKVRIPRDLVIDMSSSQVIITLFCIIIAGLRVYFLLQNVGFFLPNPNPKQNLFNSFKKKVINICKEIGDYYDYIWGEFYCLIVNSSIKFAFFHLYISKKLYKISRFSTMVIIILIFDLVPRLIVVSLFLIEIFIYQHFHYFYKSLFLLILPLIYKIIEKSFIRFYSDNRDNLAGYLEVTEFRLPNSTTLVRQYNFVDGCELPDYIKNLTDFLFNHVMPVIYMYSTKKTFDLVKDMIKMPIINIVIASGFLIGWLGILAIGISW